MLYIQDYKVNTSEAFDMFSALINISSQRKCRLREIYLTCLLNRLIFVKHLSAKKQTYINYLYFESITDNH